MKKLNATKSYQLPQLGNVVDRVNFYFNNHQIEDKELLFEACPEGVFELIFQNNLLVWHKNKNEKTWYKRDEAFVGGLHQKSYQIKLPPETEVMSVRFKPGAFKYVFGGRLNDFANERVHVSDLWSRQGLKLHRKLLEKETHQEKIEIIADFIESKINLNKRSAVDEAVKQIINQNGIIDISQLEQNSHLSPAQFRKRFREEVGLPPKKYAKIIRIKSILDDIEKNDNVPLTDLVYCYEYFDQSHFIKDFKSIIGTSPSKYCLELK